MLAEDLALSIFFFKHCEHKGEINSQRTGL